MQKTRVLSLKSVPSEMWKARYSLSDRLRQAVWAGMNQQPPVHQFRIMPFKLFCAWTKNTSSSPAQGFFRPLLCAKFFPPTYFHHLTSRSLHLQSLGELKLEWQKALRAWESLSLNSRKLPGDMRHKAWGWWRDYCCRNVKRRRQEEPFIPNVEMGGKKR